MGQVAFKEHVLTPQTEQDFFGKKLAVSIMAGESVTVFRVPASGARREMLFFKEHADSFGLKKLGKYRIIIVNPLSLVSDSPQGCFELMINSLASRPIKKAKASAYFVLKEIIEKYLEKGFHLIFIFTYFDRFACPKFFFDNLHSFYQLDRKKVHFVFLPTTNILAGNNIEKYGQLSRLTLLNIVYFPILSGNDAIFVARRLNKKYGYGFADSRLQEIIELAGGHPALIRHCLELVKNRGLARKEWLGLILKEEITNFVLREIWDSLLAEDKRTLFIAANGTAVDKEKISPYLLNLGYLSAKQNGWVLFSPLFEAFVLDQQPSMPTISLNEQKGQILINGKVIREKIAPSVYKLLCVFIKSPNEMLSRERIAKVLWGEEYYEKYSDWTIDQTVFLVRQKLRQWGISPENLQTIKGWGYRWIS